MKACRITHVARLVLLTSAALLAAGPLQTCDAQDAPPERGFGRRGPPRERILPRMQPNTSAGDAVLEEPEPLRVSLTLVELSSPDMQLKQLDLAAVQQLLKAVETDANHASLLAVSRLDVFTTTGGPTIFMTNDRVPVPTSVTVPGGDARRAVTAHQYQEVGTKLELQLRRVDETKVIVGLDVERSQTLQANKAEAEENPAKFTPPTTASFSYKGLTQLPIGRTTIVHDSSTITAAGPRRHLLLLLVNSDSQQHESDEEDEQTADESMHDEEREDTTESPESSSDESVLDRDPRSNES